MRAYVGAYGCTMIPRTDEHGQMVVQATLGLSRWFSVTVNDAPPACLIGETEGPRNRGEGRPRRGSRAFADGR